MTSDFEQKLEKYAEVIINGLNLQPGQRLRIRATSLDAAPLIRKVVAQAYQHGSRLVHVEWVDEILERIRYQHAPRDSFEEYPTWIIDGALLSADRGDAFLFIICNDPGLLKDQDPELIAIANRSTAKHAKPINEQIRNGTIQRLTVAPPTSAWAAKVFPTLSSRAAEERLWEAVFKACRLNEPDPVAFWENQVVELGKRVNYLNTKHYTGLKFVGPGTNLEVGLPDGHIWGSANVTTPVGISHIVNIPTEEVFTLPHKDKVNGTVTATKPLAYLGNLIENFSLTFSEGEVVDFKAEKGAEILQGILETDKGAKRLGEVALVPHQSPISQMDILFLNILYDENASNHLALGNAYPFSIQGGREMTAEELAQAGANTSLTHVDFMFGSAEIEVDGVKSDGSTEPVMRSGEWAFDV